MAQSPPFNFLNLCLIVYQTFVKILLVVPHLMTPKPSSFCLQVVSTSRWLVMYQCSHEQKNHQLNLFTVPSCWSELVKQPNFYTN